MRLLSSIRTLFETNAVDCMTSQQIVADLPPTQNNPGPNIVMVGRSVRSSSRTCLTGTGSIPKPYTAQAVKDAKGYRLDQLNEVFGRYLQPAFDLPADNRHLRTVQPSKRLRHRHF